MVVEHAGLLVPAHQLVQVDSEARMIEYAEAVQDDDTIVTHYIESIQRVRDALQ